MSGILKIREGQEDDEKELRFELTYLSGLTVQQRFDLMLRKSREMAEALRQHGHGKTTGIVKRA